MTLSSKLLQTTLEYNLTAAEEVHLNFEEVVTRPARCFTYTRMQFIEQGTGVTPDFLETNDKSATIFSQNLGLVGLSAQVQLIAVLTANEADPPAYLTQELGTFNVKFLTRLALKQGEESEKVATFEKPASDSSFDFKQLLKQFTSVKSQQNEFNESEKPVPTI